MFPLAPVVQIGAGLLLLVMGRRLYWIFVGMIGFLAGVEFGMQFMSNSQQWMVMAVAIMAGLVGIGLAIVLQRLAVALAGGLAGGILAMRLAVALGMNMRDYGQVFFLVGAVVAALLLSIFFDPMLIFVSALTGAVIVGQAIELMPGLRLFAIIGLFVMGLAVQTHWRTGFNSEPR
jgi:hypothetical protein